MNTDMKPDNDTNQAPESIQDRVFSRITTDCVKPRSKYVFWCQNSGMWLLWLLTVVLGGLATAVLIFTSTYRYYDIYEAMHDNFVTYFIEALPVLWILAFVLLVVLAARGLRATRRGYRLSPWVVGGSSVGLSVFLGIVASSLGFGYVVDATLGTYAPMYSSMVERERQLWLQPADGRLIGRTTELLVSGPNHIGFVDVAGVEWVLDTAELRPYDQELLLSKQQVRLLGAPLAGESARFHVCGVFPWMMDKQRPMKELSQQRQEAIARLYGHKDESDKRLQRLEQEVFEQASASNTPPMKMCASIAAVRRISEQMR